MSTAWFASSEILYDVPFIIHVYNLKHFSYKNMYTDNQLYKRKTATNNYELMFL